MSREILINSLNKETKEKFIKDLQIKLETKSFSYYSKPSYIYPIAMTDDHVYIPFAYGQSYPRPDKNIYPNIYCKFEGSLRPLQKEVKKDVINQLNQYGSSVLSLFCGGGKTITSIYIATKIKMKTLIIAHRIVLINQWKKAIQQFCPDATIQILSPQSKKEDCDFYIMNAINVPKKNRDFYRDIAFVVVDEIHLIMSEMLSKCMSHIIPRYVLGLSATPYREDGLNKLIDLYFGQRRIHKKLYRNHKVYKIKTSFVPTSELANNGKINWGLLLDSQCNNSKRNDMIINIVKHFPDRVFLILCKRVEQGKYIVKRLTEEGEDVTSLIGKQQEYEKNSRILVGTNSKAGTGFDHPRLNAMILASDIQSYFIQYLGRVLRTETVVPLIFDIVDKNPILERHYKVRRAVYLEHGGSVENFSDSFPDFNLI
jgi:superfamily II DNA or RNA helicase